MRVLALVLLALATVSVVPLWRQSLAITSAVAVGGPLAATVLEQADRAGQVGAVDEPGPLRGARGSAGWSVSPSSRPCWPAASERFIIGTFTSVLWASACWSLTLLL